MLHKPTDLKKESAPAEVIDSTCTQYLDLARRESNNQLAKNTIWPHEQTNDPLL